MDSINSYLESIYETLNVADDYRVYARSRNEVAHAYLVAKAYYFFIIHGKILSFEQAKYLVQSFLRCNRISCPCPRVLRTLWYSAVSRFMI